MLHSLDSLALRAHCYSPMLYLFSVAIPDEKGEIVAGDGGIRGYLHGDGGVGPGHVHQVGYRNNPKMGIMHCRIRDRPTAHICTAITVE